MAIQKSTFQYPFAQEKYIIQLMPSHTPSLEAEIKDPLIDWQLEREIYILVAIFLIGIILVLGLLNRRVENAILFALFLSGIIIALVLALFI